MPRKILGMLIAKNFLKVLKPSLTPAFTSTGKWFSAGGIGHEYLLPSSKSAFPSTKLFIF